jgi:hypothetical protein
MDDIEILDGEEWWSSKVIDETSLLINQLTNLVKLCLTHQINCAEAKSLSRILSQNSSSNSIEFDFDDCLTFCRSLSTTVLSSEASNVEKSLIRYIETYFNKGH